MAVPNNTMEYSGDASNFVAKDVSYQQETLNKQNIKYTNRMKI